MTDVLRRIAAAAVTIALVFTTHDLSFSAATEPAPVPTASPAAASVVAAGGGANPGIAPASPSSPGPVGNTTLYGDLAHLVYTATGDLSADFVTPSDGYASPTISQRFVVTTVRDAGVEIAVDGEVIPSKQIGKRVVVIKSGLTQYEFFGVILKPGPNVVSITPLGLDGLRGPSKTATIYGPGMPVSVSATLSHPLVADGKGVERLQIAAIDRWGHPAMPGATVKVSVVEGDVKLGNAAPAPAVAAALPGPQPSAQPDDTAAADASPDRSLDAPLGDGGVLSIPIHAGLVPGTLRLSMVSGDVIQTQTFYIAPYVRKAFVNGVLSIGAGAIPAAVNGDGEYDGGGARRGRAALYASGKVGRQSVLTFSYESQNRLAPLSSVGQFVDNPNERPYLTYGDASTRTDDLHSNDHVFARLDSGRSSFMWGQFTADTGSASSVGNFRQLLSGAKADINIGATHLTAFTAKNPVGYASEVLSATGLSALAQPLHADILVGSDYLTLVSIDRRTGAVLSQTPLQRNIDYTIDYATGTLRFINPPLPFDANFNPQSVLVQYQYAGVGVAAQTTGGRLGFDFGRGGATNLEFGYVNSASGSSDFALFQQSLSGKLPGGGWSISHATSRGQAPTTTGLIRPIGLDSGNAWHAAYLQRRGFNTLSLDYQNTSAGYANPYGGLSVPGFMSYRLAFQRTVPRHSDLTLSIDGQRNSGVGIDNAQAGASLTFRQYLGQRLSMILGMNVHTQHDGVIDPSGTGTPVTSSGTVAQTEVGIDYRPTSRLALSVDRTATFAGTGVDTTQPAQTIAQLTYNMDKRGKFYVRELISDAPVAAFAQATSNLSIAGNATHATQFGIERTLSPATTVTSDYLISQTGSGTDIYSAIGVQEKFRIGKNLGGNLFVQSANASGASAEGFTVWGATLNYASPNGLRAALAYQTRTGSNGGSTLSAGFAGPINPNASIVGSLNHAYAGNAASVNDQVSLAYRPAADDRLISLFGWQRSSGTASLTAGAGTDVVSFEELFRPWDGFEVAGRFAYKLDGDSFYKAHTSLAGVRVRQNLGRRFDVGAEVRQLNAANIPGARSTDLAIESGYQIGGGSRIAAGYNFSGSADPSLTGTPVRRGFYVTFTTLVDRIFGWGKQ